MGIKQMYVNRWRGKQMWLEPHDGLVFGNTKEVTKDTFDNMRSSKKWYRSRQKVYRWYFIYVKLKDSHKG